MSARDICPKCGSMYSLHGNCEKNQKRNANIPFTTEEFFEQNKDLKLLVSNLETNLEQIETLTVQEREYIMRLNLIVIKQYIEDTK